MKRSAQENQLINQILDMAKAKCGLELHDFSEIDFDNDSSDHIVIALMRRVAIVEMMALEDFLGDDHKYPFEFERMGLAFVVRSKNTGKENRFILSATGNWIWASSKTFWSTDSLVSLVQSWAEPNN